MKTYEFCNTGTVLYQVSSQANWEPTMFNQSFLVDNYTHIVAGST